MKFRNVLALGLFLVALGATGAFGQSFQVRAQIDFAFDVDGKVLPAGTYDFIRDETASAFRVTDGSKNEAMALVRTRLANLMPGMPNSASVVFDKIGDKYTLAEIWMPGEDGYALNVVKEKHEHRIVKAK
jgi:hypothetical protein